MYSHVHRENGDEPAKTSCLDKTTVLKCRTWSFCRTSPWQCLQVSHNELRFKIHSDSLRFIPILEFPMPFPLSFPIHFRISHSIRYFSTLRYSEIYWFQSCAKPDLTWRCSAGSREEHHEDHHCLRQSEQRHPVWAVYGRLWWWPLEGRKCSVFTCLHNFKITLDTPI